MLRTIAASTNTTIQVYRHNYRSEENFQEVKKTIEFRVLDVQVILTRFSFKGMKYAAEDKEHTIW